MKKILTSLILICSLLCMPLMFNVKAESTDELENVIGMRGVWVSTVGNLDFRQKQGTKGVVR